MASPKAPELIALAYGLGRSRSTGNLSVELVSGEIVLVSVRDGAALASDSDALGRQIAALLSKLANSKGAKSSFESGFVPLSGRPLPLARWARDHVERELDADRCLRMAGDLSNARIGLKSGAGLDPHDLDPVDKALVSALSMQHQAQGRHLRDVASLARAPLYRVVAFVHFLSVIDALVIYRAAEVGETVEALPHVAAPVRASSFSPRAAALRLFGLAPDADRELVRRAFKKLVRALHPDLQPGIGEAQRRELERRLAHVNAAYLELTAG